MKRFPGIFIVSLVLVLSAFASGETLAGTVKNGTSGKAAAGDDVVLIKLAQGMEEAARTKTNAKGEFSFNLSDASDPHLIRVIHQGVTYHQMAPPGTGSVNVQVYDVAKKIQALSVTADVMRFQAQGDQLQGVRLFAVDNKSDPPRTQMNDQNFEFYLPDGAEVDTALAKTAGGQPVNSAPVPQKEKNRYAFIFPLRPGETQFQVVFHMPYSGQLTVDPKALYGSQHFVVMLPKTMQFTPATGAAFQSMQDPSQNDVTVQVASNTTAGQALSFSIAGTGLLPDQGGQQSGGQSTGGPEAATSRPGGGLGPPIDAPDPLDKFRWYILGGFAIVLVAGGIYITMRSKSSSVPDFVASDVTVPQAPPVVKTVAASPAGGTSNMLLAALKEELFQLELEHKQGHITQEEYNKAKAALDQTLERALKRQAAKVT